MPRRNHRAAAETFNAKAILGDDYKFTRDPVVAAERKRRREARADAARRRMSETHKREWCKCVVPGCDFQVPRRLDSGIEFPVCTPHAVAVWEDIEKRSEDPGVKEATAALRTRRLMLETERAAEHEADEAEYRRQYRAGLVEGTIYFIRANGLIKVGWTANLTARLKSYGPNIEVLCVYPGTRKDETTLHRQLRPSLAKGREWYHDNDIIAGFITDAVAKHGAARVAIEWSTPTAVVAGKRVHRK